MDTALGKQEEVGVDWLTITCTAPTMAKEWASAYDAVRAQHDGIGFFEDNISLLGYHGSKIGNLFVGQRRDGFMARLTSAWADNYGWMFSPHIAHTTRIDCQVTFNFANPRPHMAADIYAHLLKYKPANGRKAQASLVVNSKGGSTVYVGARSSQWYGRIYDKGVESGTQAPGTLWRYEVEAKAEAAEAVALALYGGDNVGEASQSVVWQFFNRLHIPLPFTDVPGCVLARPEARSADLLRTIAWLEGPVAEAVRKVTDAVGWERAAIAVYNKCTLTPPSCDILEVLTRECVR